MAGDTFPPSGRVALPSRLTEKDFVDAVNGGSLGVLSDAEWSRKNAQNSTDEEASKRFHLQRIAEDLRPRDVVVPERPFNRNL